MKKKLLAVLLTLCMVLGMLPMTAFAKWVVKGSDPEVVVANPGDTYETDGITYYSHHG